MNKLRGKNVVVVSAAVAMALGMASSVAFATTTQKNPPAAFGMRGPRSFGGDRNLVAALGSALGVNVATLQADFKAGKTVSEIATEQGVSSSTLISKMESSLESQLTSRVDHEVSDFVNGTKPPMMHGNRSWGGGMGPGNIMTALASDLKLTTSTLQSDLKSGKTIAEIAAAQGVSTSSLISELESTLQSQLAQAQASGKISSAVESKMASRIDTQVTDFVNGTMPPMMHGGKPWGPGMGEHNNMMTALASDLKLTTSTLQSDLKSGKTIAEIASAQGVSTSSLISELESTLQSQLAQAQASGKISSAVESKMASRIDTQVNDFVNGTKPPIMHGATPWGLGMGEHNNIMTALASDLKLTTSTLQSDLKSGKTIAEIASAQGVSTSSLISELESTLQSQLVKSVQNEVMKFVASTVPPHMGWTKGANTSQTNSLNSN